MYLSIVVIHLDFYGSYCLDDYSFLNMTFFFLFLRGGVGWVFLAQVINIEHINNKHLNYNKIDIINFFYNVVGSLVSYESME